MFWRRPYVGPGATLIRGTTQLKQLTSLKSFLNKLQVSRPARVTSRYRLHDSRSAEGTRRINFGAGRVKSVPSTRWWISPLASVQVTVKSMPPAR